MQRPQLFEIDLADGAETFRFCAAFTENRIDEIDGGCEFAVAVAAIGADHIGAEIHQRHSQERLVHDDDALRLFRNGDGAADGIGHASLGGEAGSGGQKGGDEDGNSHGIPFIRYLQ
ncbi:hypothetical protein D3C72_1495270 [compost metagenome]